MSEIITIKNLTVEYNQTLALNQINLSIPSNTRTAIIGPNGAGKSTLIKAILELVPSISNTIKIFDQPLKKIRHKIAYVPQTSEVNWNFPTTVLDIVLMGISSKRFGFQRISDQQKEVAMNALDKMQLKDLAQRQINQLSGGQKQRVFIARAIAQNADLYFLDEPLAGVDIKSEEIIMEQLKDFQKEGKTSVTVHHDLASINAYFDYIIMLNRELITTGPVGKVFNEDNVKQTYMSQQSQNINTPAWQLTEVNEAGGIADARSNK